MKDGAHPARAANMLHIGSSALRDYGFDVGREPRDTDLLCTYDYTEHLKKSINWDSYIPISSNKWVFRKGQEITEVEIAWPGSSGEMILEYAGDICAATPEICLMLKMSHRYLRNSPHFLKTMRDIQMLRGKGVVLNDTLQAILRVREDETYWYEHPNLNRKKEDFFVDSYLFDHDSLHEAVALGERPAYLSFQKPGREVMCDMKLFFNQPFFVQLSAVYEETCVLALERAVIPHGKDEQWAFEKALMKVCTSITSGKFREFAWENYDRILELKKEVKKPYTTAFYEGIISGVVTPN